MPSPMRLKTRIETPRWTETVAFYRDILGLEVLQSWESDGDTGAILGWTDAPSPVEALEIAQTDSPVAYRGLSLQFRVPDLEAALERLRDRWAFTGPKTAPGAASTSTSVIRAASR